MGPPSQTLASSQAACTGPLSFHRGNGAGGPRAVMELVIDVSVAAKWLLPAGRETLVEEAEAVLVRYSRKEVRLLVPDLFWSEFGNVLWKAVWQKRFDEQTALRALNQMRDYRLETRPSEPLLDH